MYLYLSYCYVLYIKSTGACPTVTYPISQVRDPILPMIPLYLKYWTLPYRYIPCITSTGLLSSSAPTSTGPFLQLPPQYHIYWTLSDRFNPFITRSGHCPTGTSPIAEILEPVLRKRPYITST